MSSGHLQILISFQGFGDHVLHFLADVGGFEDFDAGSMGEQFAEEVGGGADVEREVGVVLRGGYLALRVVQRHGAQVVGGIVMGADDDVGHGCVLVGQHAEIVGKIGFCREVGRHLEGLVGLFHHGHAVVEGVDAHLVLVVFGQQIPTLLEALHGVGADGLYIALGIELLVAQMHTAERLGGADDGLPLLPPPQGCTGFIVTSKKSPQ